MANEIDVPPKEHRSFPPSDGYRPSANANNAGLTVASLKDKYEGEW